MVWLERFVLALLALIFWNWVLNNGLQMDGHFRIALGLVLLGVSYGIGHAVYLEMRKPQTSPSVSPAAPSPSPNSTSPPSVNVTSGPQSPIMPNNSGVVKITNEDKPDHPPPKE
jgi:hypothetical protein